MVFKFLMGCRARIFVPIHFLRTTALIKVKIKWMFMICWSANNLCSHLSVILDGHQNEEAKFSYKVLTEYWYFDAITSFSPWRLTQKSFCLEPWSLRTWNKDSFLRWNQRLKSNYSLLGVDKELLLFAIP